MDSRRFHPILPCFLAAGALAALTVLFFRHQVEARNRTVELTVDYAQVAQIAAAAGLGTDDTLAAFKAAGVTSVALSEESVADLIGLGAARVEQARVPGVPTPVTALQFTDAAVRSRVEEQLLQRFPFKGAPDRATSRVMLL